MQWGVYGQSKTANILHAKELNRRYYGDGIIAVSLHPGLIETELWRHAGVIMSMNKTIPQGAATSVFCCVSPTIIGGQFYNDCAASAVPAHANNEEDANLLWELSAQLTNNI